MLAPPIEIEPLLENSAIVTTYAHFRNAQHILHIELNSPASSCSACVGQELTQYQDPQGCEFALAAGGHQHRHTGKQDGIVAMIRNDAPIVCLCTNVVLSDMSFGVTCCFCGLSQHILPRLGACLTLQSRLCCMELSRITVRDLRLILHDLTWDLKVGAWHNTTVCFHELDL